MISNIRVIRLNLEVLVSLEIPEVVEYDFLRVITIMIHLFNLVRLECPKYRGELRMPVFELISSI